MVGVLGGWGAAAGGERASLVLVHAAGFSLTPVGTQTALSRYLSPGTFDKLRVLLFPLVLVFGYLLPPALLAGWASMLAPHEPEGCWVYGTGVILAGASVLLCAFAIGAWRARRWAVSARIIAALTLALFVLPLVLQLALVLQRPNCATEERIREFPYTALTAAFMALNMLPMIALIYLNLGTPRPPPPHAAPARAPRPRPPRPPVAPRAARRRPAPPRAAPRAAHPASHPAPARPHPQATSPSSRCA